jgi:hypothetical protein
MLPCWGKSIPTDQRLSLANMLLESHTIHLDSSDLFQNFPKAFTAGTKLNRDPWHGEAVQKCSLASLME